MSAIDHDLDSRLSNDQPSNDEKKFQKAEEVKEAFRELGEANGEFAEFLREYLFSSKSAFDGDDARGRSVLLEDLQDSPLTVDGCTVSLPNQRTVSIAQ
jgi:hypothetical protein